MFPAKYNYFSCFFYFFTLEIMSAESLSNKLWPNECVFYSCRNIESFKIYLFMASQLKCTIPLCTATSRCVVVGWW